VGGGACCSEAGRAPRVGRRRGDGGRRRPGALASALGGGVGVGGVTGRQRGHRGGGAATEDGAGRANGRRRCAERPAGAASAQGGGTGRRRRGGRSSERVAELGAARSEGEKEEEPARPSIYRESLRYRVKSKTGT